MANKFYVHNDIFRYEDEVFGDSEAELDEGKTLTSLKLCACHSHGSKFYVLGCLFILFL